MARPKAKELTERELEVMQEFWIRGECTATGVRDALENNGRSLAYTTVATLIRILTEKNFLEQTHEERPFRYQPTRSFEEVSGSMLGDLMQKVFGGSREQLLIRLLDQKKLTKKERDVLSSFLKGQAND